MGFRMGVGGLMVVVVLALSIAMGDCSTQPTPEIMTEAPPLHVNPKGESLKVLFFVLYALRQ
ncbi:hypothetical protein SK128_013794 [Halocaridina rubra]|uniref:Uncharacterized protein n=1 Tax=Halocaridina rubra TaxID=373956 RepID=A0AAN8XUE2_HALRR